MAKAQILIDVPVKDTDRKETVELSTGGDAAFNGDMHRTSSVASKNGACLLCNAEKGKDWFNDEACKDANRRNAWDDLCISHTDPFAYFDALGVDIPEWVRETHLFSSMRICRGTHTSESFMGWPCTRTASAIMSGVSASIISTRAGRSKK